jgi:4-hydroxybenzoate decarboxylase
MPYCDLREFLSVLEREGQLVRYSGELLPEPDVGALSCAAGELGATAPAVLLDNIKGYKGKKVAVNVHGSWANHALMLDMPKLSSIQSQFFELADRWNRYPAGQVEWMQHAPCQEIVIDRNINLYETLPLHRIHRYDGGYYLSKACCVSKDPEDPDNFGKENVGIYRIQVQGPDTLAYQVGNFHDGGIHFQKAERMNAPLPVAICLGNDPMLSFMASTPIPYDQSEYKFAAALKGSPFVLTKCLDSDLDVPAFTEYVLEGEVLPGERVVEGPFGEYPGTYSGVRKQLLIKINKITHRRDPIFENLYISRFWSEHDQLVALSTSMSLYKEVKESIPEVKAINAMYQHGLTTIVSTRVPFGGFAKRVAFRVASTTHGAVFCRNIIVVDEDIDPFNPQEVMWALSCRVRDQRDIVYIPNTEGSVINPVAVKSGGMDRKLIIDATTPVHPDEMLEDVVTVEPSDKVPAFKNLLLNLQKSCASGGAK